MRHGGIRLIAGLFGVTAFLASTSAENLHFTYLWHLEQPIYWPAQQATGNDRYERAWDSILRTDAGAVASSLQVPAGNGNGTIEAAEYVAFETFRRGDLTGDWRIDPADVNDFVNVLLGLDNQSIHIRAADMNADGFATGVDIQPFVNAVLAP